MKNIDLDAVRRNAQIELARRDFFEYCHLKDPVFYAYDRKFLVDLADGLQDFLASDDDVVIINLPPRHGKSRTACSFVEWTLGKNPHLKVMTGSYNEILSTQFSKSVRNTIQEVKADEDKVVYSDIFPDTKIKHGDGAMNLWALENSSVINYLATSPTGTATGFGANLILIDDLIKNSEEAFNSNILDKHWSWFVDTMLSRLEAGGKIIVIMTRWHSEDLAGRALDNLKEFGYKVRHISKKAVQDDGTMLCDAILNVQSYSKKIKAMSEEIAQANYQQEPIDIKGRLYSSFKTYADIPKDNNGYPVFTAIKSYIDTADEGSDYLCSIIYGVYQKEAYALDVIYTKDGMEVTEPQVAKALYDYKVNIADIESNNGGRGFARAVERILKEKFNHNGTRINWFHQSKNKKARILSNSTWVMDHIYFPVNWQDRWPEFYKAVTTYQKEGKNKHDDGPDTVTGVAEKANLNPANLEERMQAVQAFFR